MMSAVWESGTKWEDRHQVLHELVREGRGSTDRTQRRGDATLTERAIEFATSATRDCNIPNIGGGALLGRVCGRRQRCRTCGA